MKVNTLITKGNLLINLPILGIYLTSYLFWDFNFISLALSTLVAYLFWSIGIPKWKLNSLRSMSSTEEYFTWYSKAMWNCLIWPEHSFFNRIEIWNKQDKLEYEMLKNGFLGLPSNS